MIKQRPRIRIVNRKHWELEGHYIGWPSALGNPFTHHEESAAGRQRVASREEAIERYRAWLLERLQTETLQRRLMRLLRQRLQEDGELVLICWCSPLPCHGSVIAELLEGDCPL